MKSGSATGSADAGDEASVLKRKWESAGGSGSGGESPGPSSKNDAGSSEVMHLVHQTSSLYGNLDQRRTTGADHRPKGIIVW